MWIRIEADLINTDYISLISFNDAVYEILIVIVGSIPLIYSEEKGLSEEGYRRLKARILDELAGPPT